MIFEFGETEASKCFLGPPSVVPSIFRASDDAWQQVLRTPNQTEEPDGGNLVYGDPVCNDAAIRAVRRWKYSPLILNGKRMSSIQRIALRCGESSVVQR